MWKGESDSDKYIPEVVSYLKEKGLAYESQGSLIMDVNMPNDNCPMPPLLLIKSNGAVSYELTDLATLWERVKEYNLDEIWYVVDNRQSLHFEQVFRAAYKSGIVPNNIKLEFLGFGTMNGKDGKPFKTRDGGVMTLENLIKLVKEETLIKMNPDIKDTEKDEISDIITVAALKYADLSNQISKDYIFDVDKFTSFEGKTGPYILYTLVRIKSILNKYFENNELKEKRILAPKENIEKEILLTISKYSQILEESYKEDAPSKICTYLYELANNFNSYYQKVKILQGDSQRLESNITLLILLKKIFENGIDLLGFSAPEKM